MSLNKTSLLILSIILIGVFFRAYQLTQLAGFGHDEDLAAWIVRDVVVNQHPRLIGQETSIDGVFIGPLFYYLQIPFFALLNMHPLSAQGLTLTISVLTIISIYFVLSRLTNKVSALTGSFIYATTLGVAMLDRWTVPTQPTILWSVWYLYVVFNLLKGNLNVLPILAILIGLIWHVHVAFIPLLALLPVSLILSKQKVTGLRKKIHLKSFTLSLLLLLALISPLIAFEYRHGYPQTQGLIKAFSTERGEAKGIERAEKVLLAFARSNTTLLFHNNILSTPQQSVAITLFLFVGLLAINMRLKLLNKPQLIVITVWILLNLLSQLISKRAVSEYYFNNLFTILLLLISLYICYLKSRFGSLIILGLTVGYISLNLWWLLQLPTSDYTKFNPKNEAVRYISNHSRDNGYPCIAINFITLPGITGGFRYIFWWNNVDLVTPGPDVPIYNIVIPSSWSASEISASFGPIGIIPPKDSEYDSTACTDPDRQLLEPWGFTTR